MRQRPHDHFSRGDEFTGEMPVRDDHSADQTLRLGFWLVRFDDFHAFAFRELRGLAVASALRISRCTAVASKPARRNRLAISFATITDRWRPPVQPIPTV